MCGHSHGSAKVSIISPLSQTQKHRSPANTCFLASCGHRLGTDYGIWNQITHNNDNLNQARQASDGHEGKSVAFGIP